MPIIEITNDTTTPIATKRGFENSVSHLVSYAIEQMKVGLYFSPINISYAGDLNEIYNIPKIEELKKVAKEHKVKVVFGVMTLSPSTVYGPVALSLGIAPKNQKSKPI